MGQRGHLLLLLQLEEGRPPPEGSEGRDEAQDGALHALALRAAPEGAHLILALTLALTLALALALTLALALALALTLTLTR